MKLSFTTLATPRQSGEEAIKLARKYGYQGIDLRVSEQMGELSLKSSKDELRTIKQALKQEGIRCASLLCYNDSGNEAPSSWAKMEDSIIRHIALAKELDAEAVRIFTGTPYNAKARNDFIKRTAQSLSKALSLENSNVQLLVQNHQYNSTALETAELVAQIANPRAGMIFSPDHCVIENENMEEVLKTVAAYTKQLYFADMRFENDKLRHVLPGNGQVPLSDSYKHLAQYGFSGWLTFKWEKIWHPELEEPETALPYFIHYITELVEHNKASINPHVRRQ